MASSFNIDLASKYYKKEWLEAMQLFRDIALIIDHDPAAIQQYIDHPVMF